MTLVKYRDENGNLKELWVSSSYSTSEVYIGSEEPIDPSYKVWYDISTPIPIAKCLLPSGEWVVVAGGGSDVDYITDEEYEEIMKEVGI